MGPLPTLLEGTEGHSKYDCAIPFHLWDEPP